MSDQTDFAQALLDPALRVPAGLRTWNGSDPARRFAVYRNNVVVSLIDALADTFAVTQALVGEEFFRAMARAFIQSNGVKTRVLAWVGADFADFIAAFPPAATLGYLADVARLEMLRVRAYHAADAPELAPQALGLALADPQVLPNLRLTLHPGVGLLQSPYAVHSVWAAHQGALPGDGVDPYVAQAVLVYRRALDVEVLGLSAGQAHFVARLMGGAGLAMAANEAAQHDEEFDLSPFLAMLLQRQLVSGLHTR